MVEPTVRTALNERTLDALVRSVAERHADTLFDVDGEAFRDAARQRTLEGRVLLPSGARLRTAPTILTTPGQPGSIEHGQQDQRGFELVIEPSGAGRKAEFDVSFRVTVR
jgi:hypothetical protein